MKLYRINWEWDEYLGAGEYETKGLDEYVIGDRMLGKAIYEGFHSYSKAVNVTRLDFSWHTLCACIKRVHSNVYNVTSRS